MAESASPILVDDDESQSSDSKRDEVHTDGARETTQIDPDNTDGVETDGPPTTSYTAPINKKHAAAKTDNAAKPLLARRANPIAKAERTHNRAKFLALVAIALLVIGGFLIAYFVFIEPPTADALIADTTTTAAPSMEPTVMPTEIASSTPSPTTVSTSTTASASTTEQMTTPSPSAQPSSEPTAEPTAEPTMEPTVSGGDNEEMDVLVVAAVAGGAGLCVLLVICFCCCCYCNKGKNTEEVDDDGYGQMAKGSTASELVPTTVVKV
eukprot:CAMPEP_0197025538 /NCGR_PEP_ID=MMETSP1384-20130603/5834_1 /TAXON_ID=29189 /ORGANISM="Ammonia sp." /LENGTH=266 /DNA_ID=CAMNT_0042454075 /DNA_START=44 /DNA_END=844 /DNA_ORIENTATION=+